MTVDSPNTLSRHLRRAAGLDNANPTDAQLLHRFASEQDEAAFTELVRRHGPMVLGVCRRIAGNTHDAEDAFQATFLVLARKARSVVELPSLGAWLHGVAYRAALKTKTTVAKRQAKEATAARPEGLEPMPEQADILAVIERELGQLPKKYREPLVMCALCGRTRKEVATELGIAEGTLASRIAKAREMLSARLRRRGVGVPAAVVALATYENATATSTASLTDITVKIATGTVPATIERIASGVTRAMFLNKFRATAFLLIAVAIVCAAGAAFAFSHPTEPNTPMNDPPKPVAEKPENGVYLLKFEGVGRKVKLTDGSDAVLGKQLSESIGTGVKLQSQANDNSRFYLHVKELGPLPKEVTEEQTALVVDGLVLHIGRPEKRGNGDTVEIGANVYSAEAAKALAAQYKIEAQLRKHPGHRFEVRWTPDKPKYEAGETVILKLELKNTGTDPLRFTRGGKQRGTRDNQFRFIAQKGIDGPGLPDSGDATNFGGMMSPVTLKPGESYTAKVDLSKWFKFTEANTYRITGILEMPIIDPNSPNWPVLWDDLAVGECSIRVMKRK